MAGSLVGQQRCCSSTLLLLASTLYQASCQSAPGAQELQPGKPSPQLVGCLWEQLSGQVKHLLVLFPVQSRDFHRPVQAAGGHVAGVRHRQPRQRRPHVLCKTGTEPQLLIRGPCRGSHARVFQLATGQAVGGSALLVASCSPQARAAAPSHL